MKQSFKYIFFDLDRTLWDFEKNMHETMVYLYNTFLKSKINATLYDFIKVFNNVHEALWEQYNNGKIKKNELRNARFHQTLQHFGLKDYELSKVLNKKYLETGPLKINLTPYAKEILEYLKPKYSLYILTNGFKQTQQRKLAGSGLKPYFKKIFSSEEIGYNKPHPKIFAYAVNSLNARKEECIMIGDDPLTDVKGAREYGLAQVYYNPGKVGNQIKCTCEIHSLIEIKSIL